MKKITPFIFLFSIASLSVSAHRPSGYISQYEEWADKPVVHPVPPEYANEPAIILLENTTRDYITEGKGINMYVTEHRIVKVLDDRGINVFNTLDFPVGSNTRVPSVRARTILPNGKVSEIAQDMIKVTRNPRGYWSIIIAMEGVEKNAEIEYLVREIMPGASFGSEVYQYPIPVLSAHFAMSYPKELIFLEKGYNGFPDVKDTLIHNRRHMDVTVYDIPKLKPEAYSYYDLRRMRMEYRLDHYNYQNENDSRRQNTWSDLGKKIHDDYYKITDKEKIAVNAYLSELGVKPNGNELENIKKIENGIKTGIFRYSYVDYDERNQVLATQSLRSVSLNDAGYDNPKNVLDSIITKRAATSRGITRLFAACFVQAGINHELGYTGDRHQRAFDKKFENWNDLKYSLFYFPDLDKYIAPTETYLRYPMVPEEVLANKGVFCTIPPNGIPTGPLCEIRTITPPPAEQTQANIAAAVSFTNDMDAQIDISYSYTGYSSTSLRERLATEPKQKEKDLIKAIVTVAEKPSDIVKYTISNEGFNNYGANKPLEITATVNTSKLTEIADKNYLFKVGEIIGHQKSLYNEDPRVLPVDLDLPTSQTRTITINLPIGAKVLNPEALRMHADYVNSEIKPVIGFNSDYTLIPDKKNGDKLIITVNEFYSQLHFAPYEYERYREVINKAADFYKVALLIAPKKATIKAKHAIAKN